MKLWVMGILGVVVAGGAGYFFVQSGWGDEEGVSFTEHEAGFEEAPPAAEQQEYRVGPGGRYSLGELRTWERPEGPLRVGLQVGHLDNDDVPEELSGLTYNAAGATAAGYNERDTVEVIAGLVAAVLEAEGITVDILPTTIPPGYVADVFVAIHADGNPNLRKRGFKIAGPRRDYSGKAQYLIDELNETYATSTDLPEDPNVSRNMTAYYVFNWPRYEHAVHPYTPSVIVETGFMTNAADRDMLVNQPELPASGIAVGILRFLEHDLPPNPPPLSLTAPTLPLSGTVECATVREERRDRDERPCEASLRTEDSRSFMLVAEPPIATSSFPYEATVTGEYMPVQMLDNYFWFHYEVLGIILEPVITPQ